MQFTNILHLGALLAALQVSAAPAAEPEALISNHANELVRRANPAPNSCGPSTDQRAWPLESVQDAYNALVSNDRLPNNQKPAAGTRYYPQQYGSNSGVPTDPDVVAALDRIPECVTGQANHKFFEFPLTDPVFTGGPQGSQGPDRVIAIAPNVGPGGTRSFTYCLAMTHRGGNSPTDPSFRPCTSV